MKSCISIAFRLDDPSPSSDHALERKLFETFARHRVPLTVAAVPFAVERGTNEVMHVSQHTMPHLIDAHARGLIEVALHGHSHANRALPGLGPSEFRGVDLETQRTLVETGKACLAKIFGEDVTGFVPPWNSYDERTLSVAASAGFNYISAGGWAPSGSMPIAVLPRTCRIDRLPRALCEAQRYAAFSPVVVVVLHPDNFAEFRSPPSEGEEGSISSLPMLDEMLAQVATAGDEVRCITLANLARERGGRRLWWRSDPGGWLGRLPDRIRMRLPHHVAFSGSHTSVLWRALQGK